MWGLMTGNVNRLDCFKYEHCKALVYMREIGFVRLAFEMLSCCGASVSINHRQNGVNKLLEYLGKLSINAL